MPFMNSVNEMNNLLAKAVGEIFKVRSAEGLNFIETLTKFVEYDDFLWNMWYKFNRDRDSCKRYFEQ